VQVAWVAVVVAVVLVLMVSVAQEYFIFSTRMEQL